MNILTSATLSYVLENYVIDPFLIDIYELDKTECDSRTAKCYFNKCIEAANHGSPFAMIICSGFYTNGWGTEKSIDEAFMWVSKAAASGFAPGVFELGLYYEQGIGVDKDINKALSYYKQSTCVGFGFPALHMAWLFQKGEIVGRDICKAIKYAECAYSLGEISAAGTIAGWYEDDGNPKNINKAVIWYKRGAENGDPFASSRLSLAYRVGQLNLPVDIELANKYQKMFESQMAKIE